MNQPTHGHSMSPMRHLGSMLVIAGAGFGGLVLFGVPPGPAFRYALLLSCPLMMVWMMASMSGAGHASHPAEHHEHDGGRDSDRRAGDREDPLRGRSPR